MQNIRHVAELFCSEMSMIYPMLPRTSRLISLNLAIISILRVFGQGVGDLCAEFVCSG
jgi:hypothetical protein